MYNEILSFIRHFQNEGTIETFTQGCCYWFSVILIERFKELNPTLMYDEVINHFGVSIEGSIFDITGDVTDKYYWKYFDDIKKSDEMLFLRLKRDCIDKL